MIAFLCLCYGAIIWVVFFKLRLLPWNRATQAGSAGIGIAGVATLVISMNLFQPYSDDLRIYKRVVQIVPRVTGRVIEVPIEPNVPIAQGAVLLKIDPEPFEYQVDRLAAELRIKGIVLEDARALTGAAVAARIKLDRAQAQFDQVKASLADAQWQLRETTVFAPANGIVTELALRRGHIASTQPSASTMNFIVTDETVVIASFPQSALAYVHVGDAAEVVLDLHPGRVFGAVVKEVIPGTGQGQLLPSDKLLEWTDDSTPGRFGILLELDEAAPALTLDVGAAGTAAVYTDGAKAIRIIRKVVLRIATWLNYVIL